MHACTKLLASVCANAAVKWRLNSGLRNSGLTRRWLELFQHGSMGSMEPPAGTARRSVRRSGGVPAAFRRCRNGSGASCWNAAGTPGCSSGRSGSVPAPFRTSRGHRRSMDEMSLRYSHQEPSSAALVRSALTRPVADRALPSRSRPQDDLVTTVTSGPPW